MALGLGHKYWVHVIRWMHGTLEECIAFMHKYKPKNSKSWFELRPDPKIVKNQLTTCDYYTVTLVEDDKACKGR